MQNNQIHFDDSFSRRVQVGHYKAQPFAGACLQQNMPSQNFSSMPDAFSVPKEHFLLSPSTAMLFQTDIIKETFTHPLSPYLE